MAMNSGIFAANNWFRLSLLDPEVLNELAKEVVKLLPPRFPILPGNRPQTDGKRLILRQTIDDFRGEYEDVNKKEWKDNRNMSLMVSDFIHEALHILEGSFMLDPRPYLETHDNVSLAHTLWNVPDDARIEFNGARKYLSQDHINLLVASNEYLARKKALRVKARREAEAKEGELSLGEAAMEAFSCKLIVKHHPTEVIDRYVRRLQREKSPGLEAIAKWKEEGKIVAGIQRELFQTAIESRSLKSRGIHTVEDLLERAIEIAGTVYGRRVEASLRTVAPLYELFVEAFPDIEETFPDKGGSFGKQTGPKLSEGGGKGISMPQEGEGDEEKEDGAGAGEEKEEGEKEEGAGAGEEQEIYMGFRGDNHDFSSGAEEGGVIESLDDLDDADDRAPELDALVAGVGHTEKKGTKDPTIVEVKTYDHIRKRYGNAVTLRYKNYPGTRPEFLAQLDKHAHIRRRIIEHLERLKPNDLVLLEQQDDPFDLNMELVQEVLCDPSLAYDAKVYDSWRINTRDSLTGVLVDISGSTVMSIDGVRVIDIEKQAAGLVAQALRAIGDRVELFAFSSWDETNLYQLRDIPNLGALEPEGGNADGVAIRGLIHAMNKMQAVDKTMLVITDGKPVESGSNYDPVIDTAMAFSEAEVQGIRTVYFNVDAQASSYFNTLTKNCRFARSIRSVSQLPNVVGEWILQHA